MEINISHEIHEVGEIGAVHAALVLTAPTVLTGGFTFAHTFPT